MKTKTKTTKTKTAKPAKPAANGKAKTEQRMSGLDAAAAVLGSARQPMRIADIMEAVAKRRLWASPSGKTPGATVNAAILREIAAKGREARFKRTGRGLFAANR